MEQTRFDKFKQIVNSEYREVNMTLFPIQTNFKEYIQY